MQTFIRQYGLVVALLAVCLVPFGVSSHPLSPPTNSVVGGEPVQPGDYPWLVALVVAGSNDASCGGALIDDGDDVFTTTQWVLTAAHCFGGDYVVDPNTIEVLVGQQQLSQTTPEQRKTVNKIIMHPFYLAGGLFSGFANDIALLKLENPVTGITPIRIATPSDAGLFAPGTTAYIAGWGNLLPQTGIDAPDVAHKASVPIVDLATCNERYSGSLNDAFHLCAGQYPFGGVDTCQGDSGGPLMVSDGSGGLIHAGVVSFGLGCAWPNFPGVYAKTAFFADWITAQIQEQPHVDIWQLRFSDEQLSYPSTAAPADPITYTVMIASGPTALSGVNITTTLPIGATLIEGSISDGGVPTGTGEITWSVDTLAPNQVIHRTYQVRATTNITVNAYEVAADGGLTRDNERGQLVTLVDQPFPLVLSSSPRSAETGTIFPLKFVVFNAGQGTSANLSDLELIVELPYGIEVVGIDNGGVLSGGQVRWNITNLPALDSVEMNIFLRAGPVGEFARITNVGLLAGGTRLAYGIPAQTVFVPSERFLPFISNE